MVVILSGVNASEESMTERGNLVTFFVIASVSVAISTQIIGFASILTLLAYFTSFLR